MIRLAFLTFFEQKSLGYIQDRIVPNKVGVLKLLQPSSDVIKLLNKINLYSYYFRTILILLLSRITMIAIKAMITFSIHWNNYWKNGRAPSVLILINPSLINNHCFTKYPWDAVNRRILETALFYYQHSPSKNDSNHDTIAAPIRADCAGPLRYIKSKKRCINEARPLYLH